MTTYDFDAMTAAAYKGERVAARRLAARAGATEEDALRQILSKAAGVQGLAALLAARAGASALQAGRLAAKRQAQLSARAQRLARMEPAPLAWRAWFDGSAHPNPGRLGIGALLCGPDGQRMEISRRAGHGNSGEAEYLALIALLEAAAPLGMAQLVVYGDSQVVINDVNLAHAAGAKGLEDMRARVGELLARLPDVSLRWIPRHRNGEADRLSQLAIASWQQPGPAG